MRKHLLIIATVALVAALASRTGSAGGQLPVPSVPPVIAPTIQVDPALRQRLTTAASSESIEAIVTFSRRPTAIELAPIRAVGLQTAAFQALPMIAVRGTADQISRLIGGPGVSGIRSVYLNRQLSYFLKDSVPAIGADRVWNELGITGQGVGIAIIDTGIDGTHPDLPFGSKVIQNVKVLPDVIGTGHGIFVENLPNTDTTSGHGTHVASIAAGTGAALAGKYTGVARGANLIGVGGGEVQTMLAGLEAFDWVLQNHAAYNIRVVSNSWGTTGWPYSPDDPMNVASRMLHDAGMVVVWAAGNQGPETNTLNPYCVPPWAICVAASTKDGATLADFSSRGIPGDPLFHPTITAPGVHVIAARATTGIWVATFFEVDDIAIGTDNIRYAVASGTSMATPHVSGTAAMMLEVNPALTPDQVKSILQSTATPMPGYATHEVGAGFLNAYSAVSAALSAASTTTSTSRALAR